MVANVHYARQRSAVLSYGTIGYGLVLLLGIVGMVEAWPRRRTWAPLYLFVLTYSAGVILFFVSMRYRLPVAAGLLPFAGHGAAALVRLAVTDRPKLAMWGLGLAGLGLVIYWPSVQEAELSRDHAHTHYYLGQLSSEADEHAQASYHFSEALEAMPDNVRYKYRLSRAYIEDEREAEAAALLEEVIASEPIFLPPYLALGTLYRSQGRQQESERVLRQCVRYGPRYHLGWNNLGNVLVDLNKLEEAEAAYRQAITVTPMFIPGYQGLERVLKAQGRREAIQPVLEQAKVAGLRHYWVDQTLSSLAQ
jgi:tetratricopeptide (TPR) repeat protein